MAKRIRTQAMRILDAHKVPYTVHQFPDTIHNAGEVAEQIGLPPAQVFKTLVVLRADALNAHPLLVMVPATQELDLRYFAQEIGVKAVHMASHDQAEKLTGLKVGGISALTLLNRPFDSYIDNSAQHFAEIAVSAGQRGVDLQLKVDDLVRLTEAHFASVTPPSITLGDELGDKQVENPPL
ncbi:aminoacyl-tRNA deacylase [Dictyobacter arantiisoli]|uniref:Cys-tRNA(Pro)/Cys-tRNA(Cys) deacylase n=1 Tax=Dictyobacter arantiisoli TaxID=2014874 RepID=A0A5A5T720_9CHLR|nr:aminoacyl-tRNA deacylase [Dictyobacter arantiisoli]GCF07197.1 Cys-tRNA(Pro)/Cys-tRNA(Cys) deacylase [Dictyobacter arantiisoli]